MNNNLVDAIDKERKLEDRPRSSMIRVLLAEALAARENRQRFDKYITK